MARRRKGWRCIFDVMGDGVMGGVFRGVMGNGEMGDGVMGSGVMSGGVMCHGVMCHGVMSGGVNSGGVLTGGEKDKIAGERDKEKGSSPEKGRRERGFFRPDTEKYVNLQKKPKGVIREDASKL